MTGRSFVDTNVWVYAVDAGEPAKRAVARAVLEPTSGKDIVVSAQVLGEFFVAATRKLATPVPEAEALAMVDRMARLPVVPIDAGLVRSAITGTAAWGLSYRDSLIVAAAESSGCAVVLSEDMSDGQVYGAVRVENPFRATAGADEPR